MSRNAKSGGGGESGGGAYPNPHDNKSQADALDHGSQLQTKAYGGEQPGGDGRGKPNAPDRPATAKPDQHDLPSPKATRTPHEVVAGGQRFAVVETSGVAAAEAAGAGQAETESEGSVPTD